MNLSFCAQPKEDVYNTFIAPYITNWKVTQLDGVADSTSADYCACYFYKDYTDAAIRLIVLDNNYWTDEQLTWLISTLESARTSGYAVALASHYCGTTCRDDIVGVGVTGIDCNWTSWRVPDSSENEGVYTALTTNTLDAIDDFVEKGG